MTIYLRPGLYSRSQSCLARTKASAGLVGGGQRAARLPPDAHGVPWRGAGNSQNAAYLANVCSSEAARRRRVGLALINAARALAKQWGEPGGMPGALQAGPQAGGY